MDLALDLIEISSLFNYFKALAVTEGTSLTLSSGLATTHLTSLSIAASISIYNSARASLYLILPPDVNFLDKNDMSLSLNVTPCN